MFFCILHLPRRMFVSVNHVNTVISCIKALIERAQIINGYIAYATAYQTIEIYSFPLYVTYFNQFLASTSNLYRMNKIIFKILYAFFSLSC